MLAYHQSEGGPWPKPPGAWLPWAIRRDFSDYVRGRRAGDGGDPAWRVVQHLLAVRQACRDILKHYDQHTVLGRQAAMMVAGKFDSALLLPALRPAQAQLDNDHSHVAPELPHGPPAAGQARGMQFSCQIASGLETDTAHAASMDHIMAAAGCAKLSTPQQHPSAGEASITFVKPAGSTKFMSVLSGT